MSELIIHNFGFGPDRNGTPSVSFSVTLPSGVEGTFGWAEDEDDAVVRQRLIDLYGAKIVARINGDIEFIGNVQDMEFNADTP